jgi:hypothetical protein
VPLAPAETVIEGAFAYVYPVQPAVPRAAADVTPWAGASAGRTASYRKAGERLRPNASLARQGLIEYLKRKERSVSRESPSYPLGPAPCP